MDQAGARAYFSIQSEGGVNAVIGALALNPTLYFEILKKMLLRRNVFAFIYGGQVALSFTDATYGKFQTMYVTMSHWFTKNVDPAT